LFRWIREKVFSGEILDDRLPKRLIPRLQARYTLRALGVLPAVPWLRGLAKTLRGIQIGGLVVQGALKFQALLARSLLQKKINAIVCIQSAYKRYRSKAKDTWEDHEHICNEKCTHGFEIRLEEIQDYSFPVKSFPGGRARARGAEFPNPPKVKQGLLTVKVPPLVISEEAESLDMDMEPSVLRRYISRAPSKRFNAEGFQASANTPITAFRPRPCSRSLSSTLSITEEEFREKWKISPPPQREKQKRASWCPVIIHSPTNPTQPKKVQKKSQRRASLPTYVDTAAITFQHGWSMLEEKITPLGTIGSYTSSQRRRGSFPSFLSDTEDLEELVPGVDHGGSLVCS